MFFKMTKYLIKALEEDNMRQGGRGQKASNNVQAKRLNKRQSNPFIRFSSIFRATFKKAVFK